MTSIWKKISTLGLETNDVMSGADKRLRFFNQVLFIGFFATLFHTAFVWPFIGFKSLIFLVVCIALATSLWLNSKGKHSLSKWVYTFALYSMGVITTLLLGGSALFHIQVLLIFISCLIIFESKDRIQLIVGIPAVTAIICIGEFNLMDVPDFSNHPWFQIARIANISSLFLVMTIFTFFILGINTESEKGLSDAIAELKQKKLLLEDRKSLLEDEVSERVQELREQKDVLTKKNEEKEILLHEVHHRVRNNLQIIVSLIKLQLGKDIDSASKQALREIQTRVDSMSIVHQRMYQTSNFKNVFVKDYLNHLVENMSNIYSDDQNNFQLTIEENFPIKMEAAVPLGLIFNEIISNFFKHVHNEENAHFSVEIKKDSSNYIFKYKDNGKGFESSQIKESKSLGISLITSLLEQLDGTLEIKSKGGAVYIFSIPSSSLLTH